MFQVRVDSEFSAAHSLRGYRGRCEELHGHNWKVEVVVAGRKLDKIGMLIDFKQIKSQLNKILQGLDHKHLNSLSYFKRINPTSENIAKYVYDKLKSKVLPNEVSQRGKSSGSRSKTKKIATFGTSLKSVTVWESESSSASYYDK